MESCFSQNEMSPLSFDSGALSGTASERAAELESTIELGYFKIIYF